MSAPGPRLTTWITPALMFACVLLLFGTPHMLQLSRKSSSDGAQMLSNQQLRTSSKHTNFDWEAYLQNYPELLEPPTSLAYTEDAAWQHYKRIGRRKGRIAARVPLRLRYATGGGLTNQLLCHLSAFMIAREIGAGLVLAPMRSRAAFKKGPQDWTWEPSESIFDVDKMAAVWKPRGLIVHKTPNFTEEQKQQWFDLLSHNAPVTAVYGNGSCITIHLPRPSSHLATIAQQARQRAVAAAEAEYKRSKTVPECINLDSTALFFATPVQNALSLAISSVHGGFFFNQTLLQYARRIEKQIGGPYSAVHLRLEDDAVAFNQHFGGEDAVLQLYLQAMANTSFTSQTTVYVASGLGLHAKTPRSQAVVKAMQDAGLAKKIVYKEQFLSAEVTSGLHSEQLALIDMLVSASSQAFVGHPYSTMSAWVEQMRICRGYPASSNGYIHLEGKGADSNEERFRAFVRFAFGYQPNP